MERIRIQRAIEEYEEAKRQRQLEIQSMGLAGAVVEQQEAEDDEDDVLAATLLGSSAATDANIRAHVPVPSQEDIAVRLFCLLLLLSLCSFSNPRAGLLRVRRDSSSSSGSASC